MLNLFGYIYLERQNVPQTIASKKNNIRRFQAFSGDFSRQSLLRIRGALGPSNAVPFDLPFQDGQVVLPPGAGKKSCKINWMNGHQT